MEKTNERKIKKTFILGKHHADLLRSSEKGLLFEISNDENFNITSLYIYTKEIKKIGKVIYDRLLCIDNSTASSKEINGSAIAVIHKNNEGKKIHDTINGKIVITTYIDGLVSIIIYANNQICERISFKLNEVEVE